MKILVLSDSHRNIDRMRYAVDFTEPDVIVHLGDHLGDAQQLQSLFHDIVIYMVKGNCDFQADGANELFVSLGGVKLFLTHGHVYGVKFGLYALKERAQVLEADIALYGHTHRAVARLESGLLLLCPGQLERHDNSLAASYGIVTVEGGSFEHEIVYLQH